MLFASPFLSVPLHLLVSPFKNVATTDRVLLTPQGIDRFSIRPHPPHLTLFAICNYRTLLFFCFSQLMILFLGGAEAFAFGVRGVQFPDSRKLDGAISGLSALPHSVGRSLLSQEGQTGINPFNSVMTTDHEAYT